MTNAAVDPTRPLRATDSRAHSADEAERYHADGWWTDDAIWDHVSRHAEAKPDATAFVSGTTRLTWAGYRDGAERLAGVLLTTGLERGDRVAVWLPDGPTVHVAFVACELAGLVVVGIGARAGRRELDHLLAVTDCRALIGHAVHRDAETAPLVAELAAQVGGLVHVVVPDLAAAPGAPILVDGVATDPPADAASTLSARRFAPDELSMINSTSGTTGLPKCVMHTQNRWWAFHRMAVEAGDLSPDDVFCSAIPAPFGFGLWTAHYTPTFLGAPCVLVERFHPDELIRALAAERVTVLGCVSTQFIMMLASDELERHDLTALRVMFTGGEAVPYERAAAFEDRTGATVLQFYGSNETGAISRTTLRDSRDVRLRTAGGLIPVMQVRMFDEEGAAPTDAGRGRPAGRGPACCLGYWGDAGANDQLFSADGWMLMGDVVEIDADGCLSVVGRTSDFIIRGGKNISAPVVEELVQGHPAIVLAAAVAVPDPIFGERVGVVVQVKEGQAVDLAGIAAHLKGLGAGSELLPEHLLVVDEIPRSSGGKVAKGDLRELMARHVAGSAVMRQGPIDDAVAWGAHGFHGDPGTLTSGGSLARAWVARWASAPDAPVLRDDTTGWVTAGALADRTAEVAARLAGAGLDRGDRILMSSAPSVDLVVAHVAALRLGAIVVPVNTALSPDELARAATESRASIAVLDDASRLAVEGVRIVGPDVDLPAGPAPVLDATGPDDPALLVFTSGTTGRPKGASLSHGNLLASAEALRIAWGWEPGDRLVLGLPLFHMHGLGVGVHGTLLAGASAVIVPRFDVDGVLDVAADEAATLFFGVPTMYVRLAESHRVGELARLRLCVSGSAPMAPDLWSAIAERGGQRVLERYGMTETAMNVSNPLVGDRRPGSVGLALPGVRVRLADPVAGGPDGPGDESDAPGEILLQGPNVMRRYWERPDVTAEAFDEGGWFRTGDVGRFDPDGYLRIVGRSKDIIITGGYNVYPRDVEEVLREHPAVADAAVVGRPDPTWGETVVACVITRDAVSADDLAALCADRLAPDKRPREWHFVDEFPRNALGKVVKSQLLD